MRFIKELLFKIAKHFYVNAYAVGYRTNVAPHDFDVSKDNPYRIIMPTKHEWYADPFPFIHNGKRYIFVEIMNDNNKGVGKIGVCCADDDNPSFKCVIDEPFHMSYPNVFSLNGEIYMIPETYQTNKIILYKCVSFPDKWEKDSVLFEGAPCVDTSLFFSDNEIFAITWQIDLERILLFRFDILSKKFLAIDPSISQIIHRRPGGNFIRYKNGAVYHPLQDCTDSYGNFLHIAKVNSFNAEGLMEEKVKTYRVSDISHDGNAKFCRNHTFNRFEDFEVVDLQYKQINIFNKARDCD